MHDRSYNIIRCFAISIKTLGVIILLAGGITGLVYGQINGMNENYSYTFICSLITFFGIISLGILIYVYITNCRCKKCCCSLVDEEHEDHEHIELGA